MELPVELESFSYTIVEDLQSMQPGATVMFEFTDSALHESGTIKKMLSELYGVPESQIIQTQSFFEWKLQYLKEQKRLFEKGVQQAKVDGKYLDFRDGQEYTTDELEDMLAETREDIEHAEMDLEMCSYPAIEPLDGRWPGLSKG